MGWLAASVCLPQAAACLLEVVAAYPLPRAACLVLAFVQSANF